MYKLYYAPGACSMAVHVTLHECGLNEGKDFTLTNADLHNPAGRNPDFVKDAPAGQVPVLMIDGEALSEGAAILTYLCDTQGWGLPKSGMERARALKWLAWCNSSLHAGAYGKMFFLKKNGQTDGPLMDAALEGLQTMWDTAEAQLGKTTYLAGNDVTVADILLTVIANWQAYLPKPMTYGPNLKRLLKDISSRPAYQKALAHENVEYKAAA